MLHFWQTSLTSIENTATFRACICLTCTRISDPDLQAAARPICIANSYDTAEILDHISQGNPYIDNLDSYYPEACTHYTPA